MCAEVEGLGWGGDARSCEDAKKITVQGFMHNFSVIAGVRHIWGSQWTKDAEIDNLEAWTLQCTAVNGGGCITSSAI